MGDDTPSAVLSGQYRPLSHFFRQNFSQVTNPPIDSLREYRVMSLKTRFGNLKNVLDEDSSQTEILVLDSPFVGNAQFEELKKHFNADLVEIDCTFAPGTGNLNAGLQRIRAEAEDAVRSGAGHLVLTDHHSGEGKVAMPMILATSAVHSHLDAQGLAHLHLAERAVGGMHRPALLRRADRLRGDDRERLSRRGQPCRPDRTRPARRHPHRGRRALPHGHRPGSAEDHGQDGHLGCLLLSRRSQLRGGRPEPCDGGRIFPRHDQPDFRHRRLGHPAQGRGGSRQGLVRPGFRPADRRLLQGAQDRRDPRLGSHVDAHAADRLQQGLLRDVEAVFGQDAEQPADPPARPAGHQAAGAGHPDRRGREHHLDPQAVCHAGHVAWRASAPRRTRR